MTGEALAVPAGDAELLISRVNSLIGSLDSLITGRGSKRESHLAEWVAPNRVTWDEDFFYGQLDLQAVIDTLQAFKEDVADVVQAVRDHNAEMAARTTTGTTTTSTTTTTVAGR